MAFETPNRKYQEETVIGFLINVFKIGARLTLHEAGMRRRVLGDVHDVGLRVERGRVLVHVQHVQPRLRHRRGRRAAGAL